MGTEAETPGTGDTPPPVASPDDRYMRDSDALAWNMEQDPGLRSTIVAVTWLEGRPDPDVLAARLERATRLAPRFRQRPVATPGRLSTPRWVDGEFTLAYHLRRVRAPEPGRRQAVLDFARTEALTPFDPARPLWVFTVVEGLEGGGSAFVMRVHHSLTDGVGGMQLALLVFELTPEPGTVEPVPTPAPAPDPGPMGLGVAGLARSVGRAADTVREGLGRALPAAVASARHPLRTTFDVVATVGSVGRMVQPVSETLSPVMTRRGLDRKLALFDVDLGGLKRAGAAVGGTLNDAFVASVTGGLRRYHELHGAPVAELRVTMPISLRRPEDPAGGNRITLERFTVPVGEAHPGTRIRMTGWRCRAAQREEALPLSDTIAGALNLLPPGVVGSMLKHVDFVASNVPGIPVPLYLAGAPVTGYHAFGPTTGAAFNVTLVSYRRTCHVGCTIDTAAVPDPDTLVASLRSGFDEVLALGTEAPPGPVPA